MALNNHEKKFSIDKIKHLEFIQNIITRMNANSFSVKGWSVSVVVLFSFLSIFYDTKDSYVFFASGLLIFLSWCMDAFYLNQERKFRGLYNDVAGVTNNPKEIKLFEMRPDLYVGGKYSYWSSFFSVTVYNVYLVFFITLLLITPFKIAF